MFKNAKVGNKVWDFGRGWGAIVEINRNESYLIMVRFSEQEQETYTLDGKWRRSDKNPTLFWDEIKFEVPEKPVPLYYAAYFHKGHWAISNQKHESIQHFRACTHSNCPAHLLTGQDDD